MKEVVSCMLVNRFTRQAKVLKTGHHLLSIAAQDSRWISSHGGVRGNIPDYDRAGPDNGALADGHATEYGGAAPNAGPALDDDGHDCPIIIRL